MSEVQACMHVVGVATGNDVKYELQKNANRAQF